MKKLTIVIIIFAVLLIGGFAFYSYIQSNMITVGPCHGYKEVGEFDQKIESENEAKQIALDYYSGIGYEFNIEDLTANKIDDGWSIRFDYSKIDIQNLCVGSANPPDCIGQELKLEEHLFGKNKILMEYQIPC